MEKFEIQNLSNRVKSQIRQFIFGRSLDNCALNKRYLKEALLTQLQSGRLDEASFWRIRKILGVIPR